MSWYRTYRPQTVAGLHITSVRENLSNMLKSGNIPHALLFAGSKGTGKTSSARIIAKVLNCEKNAERKEGTAFQEPCNECSMCVEITNGSSMNVVEMDGASNRRIDDIRQLKERLYMPPAQGKKSVYIIDEVHMLTKEAFNALLKMLEEPPQHVVFIFATTDPQKIPDTIVSRCTRVQFSRASDGELASALMNIAKEEKLTVDEKSITVIAQSADGSFRDAVKVFEQLANQASAEKIEFSFEWVSTHLSTLSLEKVKSLLDSVLAKDEKAIVDFFKNVQQQNIEAMVIHKHILSFLHHELMKCYGSTDQPFARKEIIIFLLKQFSMVEIPLFHPFPLLPLELCSLEMVLKSKAKVSGQGGSGPVADGIKQQAAAPKPTSTLRADSLMKSVPELPDFQEDEQFELSVLETTSVVIQANKPVVVNTNSFGSNQLPSANTPIINKPMDQAISENSLHGSIVGEKWQELLKTIGKRNLSLEAILRSAQFVSGEQGRVTVKVFYGFHKEQLELDRYRILIDQAIQELLAGHVRFEYVLSDQAREQASSADSNVSGKQDEGLVSAIEDALL